VDQSVHALHEDVGRQPRVSHPNFWVYLQQRSHLGGKLVLAFAQLAPKRRGKRGLFEQDPVELGLALMKGDHRDNESAEQWLEGWHIGERLREQLANECKARIDVPLGERDEDCVFVWEVLIERPDGDAGPLRNPVGGGARIPLSSENLSRRDEDGLDRRFRSRLTGPFSGFELGSRGHRGRAECEVRNMRNASYLDQEATMHKYLEETALLEGFILDAGYLDGVRRLLPDVEGPFCGYGIGTQDIQRPPVEWKGADTYIQETGINHDYGIFDSPDAFYAKHGANLSGPRRILYAHAVRHVMNAKVERIRRRPCGDRRGWPESCGGHQRGGP